MEPPNRESIDQRRAQLLADAERWEEELTATRGQRGTLWYGVYAKALKEFEGLVVATARMHLDAGGDASGEALRAAGNGRPFAKFTLGQCVDLLRKMDDGRALSPGRRIFNDRDDKLISSLVTERNDFVHGRTQLGPEAPQAAVTLMRRLRAVCDIELFAP